MDDVDMYVIVLYGRFQNLINPFPSGEKQNNKTNKQKTTTTTNKNKYIKNSF